MDGAGRPDRSARSLGPQADPKALQAQGIGFADFLQDQIKLAARRARK